MGVVDSSSVVDTSCPAPLADSSCPAPLVDSSFAPPNDNSNLVVLTEQGVKHKYNQISNICDSQIEEENSSSG